MVAIGTWARHINWRRTWMGACGCLCLSSIPAQSFAQAPPSAERENPVAEGAGSTFIAPLLSAWAAVYNDEKNAGIAYRPTGSGAGLSEITAGTADFSATDQPLAADELAKGNLAQFPIAFGAIVPVVNLAGFKPGMLRLTGPLLADIFSAKTIWWDDPAIIAVNPQARLPHAKIAIVHRSDSSGTTFNFTHYLSQVSPSWKAGIGEGKTVNWPTSISAEGNGAVGDWVKKIPNSIGYVEYAYVLTHDLAYACVQNSGGQFVCPSAETFATAVRNTDWQRAKDFNLIVTNAPGAGAYPIMATTFIVMPRQAHDRGRSNAALNFFRYGLEQGQVEAGALNYVPIPAKLAADIETYISNIK